MKLKTNQKINIIKGALYLNNFPSKTTKSIKVKNIYASIIE